MNPTQFSTAIATIPFAPRQENAKGIIAPLIRATGHLLFLLAHITVQASENHTPLTDTEQQQELTDAANHLTASNFPDLPTVSTTAKTHLAAFVLGVNNARDNWTTWAADARGGALRDLTNRAAAIGTILDREFTGLAANAVDPGSSI